MTDTPENRLKKWLQLSMVQQYLGDMLASVVESNDEWLR